MSKKKGISKGTRLVRLSAFLLAGAGSPLPAIGQTLSCPVSLLFGNYTTCNSTETATITPQNARNVTGCLSAGGAPFNRAQCNVSQGFPMTSYQISVTATQYNIANGTGDQMTVDSFQCRFQGDAGTVTGPCAHTTSGFFLLMDIGARLTVGNPQNAGAYNGTFTVNTNFP